MKKRFMMLVLALIVVLSFLVLPTSAYQADWRYWSQGDSKYADGKSGGMDSGCRLVAQAKLLVESGVANPYSFNPDIYAEWCAGKGYIKSIDIVGEKYSTGTGMIAYAAERGFEIKRVATIQISGMTDDQKKATIQKYISDGYYVILHCDGHQTYISRVDSIAHGTPYISESGGSLKGGMVYPYREGKGRGYEANFQQAHIYSVKKPFTVTATTLDTDTTDTSAILRGQVSASGINLIECGVHVGESRNDMKLFAYDFINTNSTTCRYDALAIDPTLKPGKVYYYKVYAKASDGTIAWGETKLFSIPIVIWTSEEVEPCKNHSYSGGICKDCGYEWPYDVKTVSSAKYAVTNGDGAPVWSRPYSNNSNKVDTLSAGSIVTVVGQTTNQAGNKWYKLSDGNWIYSGNVEKQEDTSTQIELSVRGASGVTATTARVDASCAYTGTRLSSVGLYIGTSESSMSYYGSDNINHNKNPFDIWYNLSNLAPSTTYYYQFYAVVNGETKLSSINYFTTAPEQNVSTLDLTAKSPSHVGTTTARVDAYCAYTGTRPSSVGLYFGTSESSLSYYGSDQINHNKNPFDIWYDLSGLSPNTTYYYQFYAVVDGVTKPGVVHWFTTEAAQVDTLDLTAKSPSHVGTTTARVDAYCAYTGTRPSAVGLYIGTSESSLSFYKSDVVDFTKNPFDIWYDLSGLTPNTTYYYQFYAVVDGVTKPGLVHWFTTQAAPIDTLDLTVKYPTNVSSTTARVNASCSYTGARPSSVGLYIGTSVSSMGYYGSDVINHGKNPFDIWYNMSGLTPNTTYYYYFYAIVNGVTHTSGVNYFTT